MKYKQLKMLTTAIAVAVLLSGCATSIATRNHQVTKKVSEIENLPEENGSFEEKSSVNVVEKTKNDYYSDRDIYGEIDYENAVEITLKENSILSDSDGVTISDSTLTITKEGTYILSGTLNDGNIIVNVSKDEKVQIVLNGATVTSKTFAPIYVVQADKVFITLADGTNNSLTNGGSFVLIDDNNVDSVIYSKDDITLNGTGTLKISSPAGKGITGKDDVTITGGNYGITSSKGAIHSNESIAIAEGTFNITSDTDGIHATTTMVIDGGTYNITAAEGLEATVITINDGEINIEASDDGINASKKSTLYSPKIEINGGNITIVMGEGDTDGVDVNGDIIINGGTLNVTGNSTFDYDGNGTINGGTVIANGEEITTLPNQMMGHGGMRMPDGGMNEQRGGMRMPDGEMNEQRGGMRMPDGEMNEQRGGMRMPDGEMNEQRGGMRMPDGGMKGQRGGMRKQDGDINEEETDTGLF